MTKTKRSNNKEQTNLHTYAILSLRSSPFLYVLTSIHVCGGTAKANSNNNKILWFDMDYVSNSLSVRFVRKISAIVICFFGLSPSLLFHMQACFVNIFTKIKTDTHAVYNHLLNATLNSMSLCVCECGAVQCFVSCVCMLLLMCNRRTKPMT